MTADEMGGIEAVLGIRLPESYRVAMLTYPLDPADSNARMALMDDARAVTAFNGFLREQFTGEWLPSYFAIGNSPCGDPYFLDLDSGSEAVWCWDHETHEVEPQAPDLENWVAALRSVDAGGGARP